MGASKGTLTYTTYYVLEEPPAGFRDMFMEAVSRHAFRDIDIEGGKDRSIGWVALGEPFTTELTWDKVFLDPYVCVSLREDLIRIPGTAFQAHYERREREFLKSEARDVIKKSERSALKADVLLNLRLRALPDIRIYDVVWNTVDGSMRLWTHSKAIRETFEDIVRESWGLRIVPHAPYTVMMARGDADPEVAAQLLDLEPADLVGVTE